MASIPNEPLNKAQIGLAAPRSGGKLSPDIEPFTLVLSERPNEKSAAPPIPPPRSDELQKTSTSPRDHSASTIGNDRQDEDHKSDPVNTTDDDSMESTTEPQQANDPSAKIVDDTDDHPTADEQPSDDLPAAVQAAAASALAASVKIRTEGKPSAAGEEAHSFTAQNLAKKRPLATPISAEQVHQYAYQETDISSRDSVASIKEAVAEQIAKNIKRRAPVAERQERVTAGSDAKTKKSRKATHDAGPAPTDVKEGAAQGVKDARPAPVKTEASSESRDRVARLSRRSSLSQTSSISTASSDSGAAIKSDATQTQRIESSARTDSAQADTPSTPAAQSVTPHASAPPAPRLQEHLVPRSTRKAGEANNLNQADQNRFLQRVARAFDAAKNRDGEIRLRLSPPELGSLRLEVRVQQGGMIARLEAETPAARTLLIDNLPALRERLAEQGVHIEQFDVDLLDRRDQSNFHDQGSPTDDRAATPRHESDPSRRASSEAAIQPEQSDIEVSAISKRINVII